MGWKSLALEAARRAGALHAVGAWYGRRRLTVLAYHRIGDADDPDLLGFAGNVSASPRGFARQLEHVAGNFEVIGMPDLLAWIDGEADLPDRAAMITFDDGYLDNLEVAAPLLAEEGFPATLFLTTGPTDGGPSLYWDLIAWVFEHAERTEGDLPILGSREWGGFDTLRRTVHEFVYATKWLPLPRRSALVDRLRDSVASGAPERIPGLYLDWDGVRALRGWSIGAHTVEHPVLTSVAPPEAARQIAESAGRITAETGRAVRSLAYPNGLEGDYDDATMAAARSAGIDVAFTLSPGPSRLGEVEADPMAIRRCYIGFNNSPAVFSSSVMGVARMLERVR
ncbi:MAG: polysaccharide deacetylase family protein [Acidimicrobiia bacterium]|nr:polysaccharide deacetylase family protein [Acidimicrobiia bacterium]